MLLIPYIYALYMSSIDVIIMSLLKARHIGYIHGGWVFLVTMVIYSIQPIIFYFGLSFKSMGIFNVLWNAISSILIALTGVYVFGETITSYNIIGIVLCISGIVLIGV